MDSHPDRVLFAVDSNGRIHYLVAADSSVPESSRWIQLPYLGVDFKRVAAVTPPSAEGASSARAGSPSHSAAASGSGGRLWALGGDHQAYVFVFGVEVPIRTQESAYENQRWNPIDGFCHKLLPTDRPRFSTADGTRPRDKDAVKLPSMAWRWEGEWYVDTNFGGQKLDRDGWTYAIDFPAEYRAKKAFSSCVRRRKWIRYRKYVATESWSAVPSLHKDPAKEPFMDISVGGHEIPNGDPDELQVWTVTVLGRVFVRQGVTASCPEGTGWLRISTPDSCEVSQISVSASGLIWAITLSGKALVRLGVSRLEPRGSSWVVLDSPGPTSPLSHVSVGDNSVWALSRDRRVWFRNGIRAASSGDNESLAKGTKWTEMVGEMVMLSVGPGDQVLGVSEQAERAVVFRTGVAPSDLSGKTWRAVTAPTVRMRADSCATSVTTSSARSTPRVSRRIVAGSASSYSSTTSSVQEGTSNSQFKLRGQPISHERPSTSTTSSSSSSSPPTVADVSNKRQAVPRGAESPIDSPIEESMYASAMDSVDKLSLKEEPDEIFRDDRSDAASGNIILDHEDIYMDDLSHGEGADLGPQWVWVSAGSCRIDQVPGPPSSWFVDVAASQQSLSGEPWRVAILQKLRDNNEAISNDPAFAHYENAIERTSWVKKLTAKFHTGEPRTRWEQCTVELEQTGSPQGGAGNGGGSSTGIDFGTLSVFGSSKKSKEHLSLLDITCVYQIGDRTLAIQTPERALKLQPLLIKFGGDLEMLEFQADLVHGMNSVHGIASAPSSPGSIFSVTSRGEVMVFDPRVSLNDNEAMGKAPGEEEMRFMQEIPVEGFELPFVRVLENGFAKGSVLALKLTLHAECQRFSINLQTGRPSMDADVALHFNPRLDNKVVVLNTRRSAEWMVEERHPVIVVGDGGSVASPAFRPGRDATVVIKAEENQYQISVNGEPFCSFIYRSKPENVTHVRLQGEISVYSMVYHSKSVIIPPPSMYWRCVGGGHFLQVETTAAGVTWAVGYDSRPWVYTGGWGGAQFKGVGSSKFGIHQVEDSKYYYVYENQRWNPLTGFTVHGLPTDRPNWSDRSGKVAMAKETVRLPSVNWQWTTDWLIDYTTPGGTDEHGWQYATDFPATYHGGKAGFTDYVRRRRWARKCRTQTSGPWRQIGSTKVLDVSMQTRPGTDVVDVWAVASNGAALYREGVRGSCSEGSGWKQVHADTQFQSVSVGAGGKVWVIAKDGSAFLRHGVTDTVPMGQLWLHVLQPPGGPDAALRCVSVGGDRGGEVWALDASNRLYRRQEVTHVFPEGSAWQQVATGVRAISASPGRGQGELWAVLESATATTLVSGIVTALQVVGGVALDAAGVGSASEDSQITNGVAKGVVARRSGVTPEHPTGTGWDIAIGGGWKHVSIRGKT